MSDHTILPERNLLAINIPASDFRIIRSPKLFYRLVFRVDVLNTSKLNLRLMARKLMMQDAKGRIFIQEAAQVFRTYPLIPPGGVFSFGCMHDFGQRPTQLEFRIAGMDQMLTPFISTPFIFTEKQLTPLEVD